MKLKLLIFNILLCNCIAVLNGPGQSSLNISKNIIYDANDTQVFVTTKAEVDKYVKNRPGVKIYSSVGEINGFIFYNCLENFRRSIKCEYDDDSYSDSLQTAISVMEILSNIRKSEGGSIDHVKALCNGCYIHGFYPLHHAVVNHKRVASAELLLKYKANIDAVDKYGKSPLYYASLRYSYKGDDKMFLLLLEYGADTNQELPLHKDTLARLCSKFKKNTQNDSIARYSDFNKEFAAHKKMSHLLMQSIISKSTY